LLFKPIYAKVKVINLNRRKTQHNLGEPMPEKSIPALGDENQYSVTWSEEDQEYVATTPAWPSLSWLDADEVKALEGLKRLVAEVEKDLS
jgi:hypothetical protein